MTAAASLFRLLQGHELAIVGILHALAALITALVKLIKALINAAGKLFRLWLKVRQERRKSKVVSHGLPRRVRVRRARPAFVSSGKAGIRRGSATRS
jgi:hypothetical protein